MAGILRARMLATRSRGAFAGEDAGDLDHLRTDPDFKQDLRTFA